MKTLMVFSAEYCQPCKKYKETLKSSDIPVDRIITIDVDDWKDITKEHNIRSVPTSILKVDGAEIRRKTGAMTLAQLKDFLS